MPTAHYEHKIGMGKPIGLGSVRIEVVGMRLIDRGIRYSSTALTGRPRYGHLWRSADLSDAALPMHLRSTQQASDSADLATPAGLAAAHMHAVRASNPAVFKALELVGDPGQVVAPVHYPQVEGMSVEQETYKWFVRNDKARQGGQGLASFSGASNALPVLSREVSNAPAHQAPQVPKPRR